MIIILHKMNRSIKITFIFIREIHFYYASYPVHDIIKIDDEAAFRLKKCPKKVYRKYFTILTTKLHKKPIKHGKFEE